MRNLRKGDLIIFVVLIVTGIFFLIYNNYVEINEGNRVLVEVDGNVIEEYHLGQQTEKVRIETDRGYNILEFADEKVQVEQANCRDQICVYFGWIERIGQTIVCLPHRLIVRVVNNDNDDEKLDGITF